MTVDVDVWLRGTDVATTEVIEGIEREPSAWTDGDVQRLLVGMLRAMHHVKHPSENPGEVTLRGLSWIVNPFESGGVVVAIEITMGAAIAGPFDIELATLQARIARVLASQTATPGTVH